MSQPHGRGHQSHTYDITGIVNTDGTKRILTVASVSSVQPTSFTLIDPDTPDPLATQLFNAASDSLAVSGKGGQWESLATLKNSAQFVRQLGRELHLLGVTNLAAPELTLAVLRQAVNRFNGSEKRTLYKLLQRALRDAGHPDPKLPGRLLNTKVQADDHTGEQPHTDGELDAFEHAARAVLTDALTAQRGLLGELGHPVDGRAWMAVNAEEVIAAARVRDAGRPPDNQVAGNSEPLARQGRIAQIDWHLLNPDRALRNRPRRSATRQSSMVDALYPDADVLVSGLIIQVLADNSGVNVATLLQQDSTNLQPLGDHTGQLAFAKARNHTAGTRTVSLDGLFSSGGIVELMTALTRFSRHWRTEELHRLDLYETNQVIADRIYVLPTADATKSHLLTTIQQHNGYRHNTRFMTALRTRWPDDQPEGLRWRALRKAALRRGLELNPAHDVTDHTPATRVAYLAQCLPDAQLAALAEQAQDDIHTAALNAFTKPDVAARLAQAAADDQLMDIGPSVCTTAGNDPDEPGRPCSLGLAACFVCPSGYRTLDHIPGLLALQEYTDIIGNHDPHEWVDGEAGTLNYYAAETLMQFPTDAVTAARESMNRDVELLNIHHVYTELRR